MDGREIQSIFFVPGHNILEELQMGDGVNTTLTRQFYYDRMEVHMRVNDVNATSIFKRR